VAQGGVFQKLVGNIFLLAQTIEKSSTLEQGLLFPSGKTMNLPFLKLKQN